MYREKYMYGGRGIPSRKIPPRKILPRKFHLWKIPLTENSTYGKFHIWKIPHGYGKFLIWTVPPMDKSAISQKLKI